MFLHCFGTDGRIWKGVADELESQYEVFAPTMPDHNRGPKLNGKATIERITDGVEQMMDDIGWDTAHIAGNSLGGWISVELAKRGRARTVTPIAPAGGWDSISPKELLLGAGFAAAYPAVKGLNISPFLPGLLTRERHLRQVLLKPASEHGELVDPREAAHMLRAISKCALHKKLVEVVMNGGHKGATNLDLVKVPTRVLGCDGDLVVPHKSFGKRYVDEIPQATYKTLRGVGHVPMLEDPVQVAQEIDIHIKENSSHELPQAA